MATREVNGWISSEPGRYMQSHNHQTWCILRDGNGWRTMARDNDTGEWVRMPFTGPTLKRVMASIHAVWRMEHQGVRRSHLLSMTIPMGGAS